MQLTYLTVYPFAISKELKDKKECIVRTEYRVETTEPNYMILVSSEALISMF